MEASHRQPTSLEEVRTLWIGGLRNWVDENFLYGCFAHTGEVQSVRLIRNKITGSPEGYGFIEFISHEAAEKALQSYNGAQMPGTEHRFRLNWASFSCGERRPREGSDHSNGPYRSTGPTWTSASIRKTSSGSRLQDGAVKGKEVVIPSIEKISRKIVCDAYERHPHAGPDHSNGGYCSTRSMRRSAAVPNTSSGSQLQNGAPKATSPAAAHTVPQAQTVLADTDLTNTTIFIGNLDLNVTEEEMRQICMQFGELIHVMIPVGEGCGFVQYASMASAKEAVQRLHGSVIGQQVVRLSWGRSPTNKQVEGATGMVSAAGSHALGMEMNLSDIDKGPKVVTDPNTGRSKEYGFVKLSTKNEKTCAIPKTCSGSQHQDGAAKDIRCSVLMVESPPAIVVDPVSPPPGLSAKFLEVKLGTLSCPIKDGISLPLRIGSLSVHATVLMERKKKKKKKQKRTASASWTTDSLSPSYTVGSSASPTTDSLSPSCTVASSAPPWGECLPVWSLPWSGLPCGCPWPVFPDDLNLQPTQYGLHHRLPDEPNEILASFKPWLQRFYGYGGVIPCPGDLVRLEAFKLKCPFSEPYVLHSGKEIGVTSSSGRFVLGELVDDVINTFKSGFSWGGDFNKDDLAVQIGVRCYISKMANLEGTYKNLCKDLGQMAESLIPHFRGLHKNNIAFIEHLYRTMKNPPPLSATTQEIEKYLKFLKSHPARADPLSTASLLVGIAQTYKSMGLSDKEAFEDAVATIDTFVFDDWIEKVKSDPLWNTVFTAKERRSSKKKRKGRYLCTPISLSTYLRHFIIHSPEHTLVDGVQLMKSIDEVDYLVADFFDNFIAELFKVLVYNFDMDKDVLKSVWKMYDAGEDRKLVIKRIWKYESELDFMLDTHEVTLLQSHVEASTSGQAMTD